MDLLIIGGSGFVSGTVASRARAAGHRVWAVTRGRRPLFEGVTSIVADRGDDAAFARAVRGAGARWDLAVDCIGYNPHDAEQDLRDVAPFAGHLIFISTDFVYDPHNRPSPQGEEAASYLVGGGYGGLKRRAELEFAASTDRRAWTLLRPCHIYGPGSELGCLPAHSRDPHLLETMAAGRPLRLVGGGRFLQQPLLARDLADVILDLAGRANAFGCILNARGPDTVESRRYYEIVGEILGVAVTVEEIALDAFARENPDKASFLTDRVYSVDRLAATGARLPATPLDQGLREHVAALRPAPPRAAAANAGPSGA